MANYNLGEARGKIVLETDLKGLSDAQTSLNKFKNSAEGTGATAQQALRSTSTASIVAGAAIAGGLAVAIKTASDFEFQMSAIQAVSGATAKEMDLITAAALRIGKDTAFSASEAGLAMEELVKAGISVTDVLGGAADATVALAAAGGIDLPQAATIAANAMNQFGLEAKDLVNVTDTIAGAANASAIDVGQFGQSMSQVGAVAKLAGLSFDDTALAITAMGNAGIVGSDAGTSLKSMLMRLNPSTKEAADLMRELGIVTEEGKNQFYDAQGNIKSLAEISDVLGGSLAGMTAEQKQATLATLFGADAIRGAAVVADLGSEGFNTLSESINKISAAEVAATRLDNLSGSVEQMGGTIETAAIVVGTALIPAIQKMTEIISGAVDWFIGLDKAQQEFIVSAAAVAAVVLIGVGVLIKLAQASVAAVETMAILRAAMATQFITAWNSKWTNLVSNFIAGLTSQAAAASVFTGVMGTLGGAVSVAAAAVQRFTLALVKNPLTLIIVAVAALVAGMITLYQTSETFRAMFVPVIEAAQRAMEQFGPVLEQISTAFMGLVDTLVSALLPILTTLIGAFLPIVELLIGLLAPILELVAGILVAVLGPALQIVGALIEALAPIIMIVLEAITPLITMLTDLLVPILTWLADVIGIAADGIKWFADEITNLFKGNPSAEMQTFGQTLLDLYTIYVKPTVDWIVMAWGMMMTVIGTVVTWFQEYVAPIFAAVFGAIIAIFTLLWQTAVNVWNGIMAVITPIVEWFMAYVAPLIAAVINLIIAVFTFLWNTVVAVWNGIMAAIGAVVEWFNAYVAPLIQAVVNLVVAIFTFLWNTAVKVWGMIFDAISTVVTNVVNFISSVWNTLIGIVSGIFNAVMGVVGPIWDSILSFISGIVNSVVSFIQGVWSGISGIVSPIFESVFQAIKGPLDQVMGFFNGLYSDIIGFFSDAGSWLLGAGEDIIGGLIEGVESMLGGLTDILNGITSMIPEVKGPERVDKVLLKPAGEFIMQGLMNGIQSEIGNLEGMLGGLNVTIPSALNADMLAGVGSNIAGGAGGNSTVPLVINVTWNAAPNDTIETRQQVMEMLGRAAELVREELG